MTLEATLRQKGTPLPVADRWAALTPAEWREYELEWKAERALASLEAELRGHGYERVTKYAPGKGDDAEKRRARRAQAYRLRDAARWVAPWDAKKGQQSRIYQCGRVSQFGEKEDTYFGKRTNGDVGLYGTQSCGKNWQCAVCRQKTSGHHSEEIGTAVQRWHESGGHVGFFTLTVRHSLEDDIKTMRLGLKEAWGMLTSGRLWNEWRTRMGAEYVLALEPKYSERNGWHLHFHGLMFTRDELEADEMREWLYERWTHVVRYCMNERNVGDWRHAVDWETVKPGDVGVGKYLSKMGFELTGDIAKGADGERHERAGRTVWEILEDGRRAHELAVHHRKLENHEKANRLQDFARRQTALWTEYVDGMYRARWVQWSKKIRAELALGPELDDSDEEAVAALEEKTKVEVQRRIPHEIRRTVLYHPTLARIVQDALERDIPVEPLVEPHLSAIEFAYWCDGNSPERLAEFSARIAERTAERRKKRHEQAQEERAEREAKNAARGAPPAYARRVEADGSVALVPGSGTLDR